MDKVVDAALYMAAGAMMLAAPINLATGDYEGAVYCAALLIGCLALAVWQPADHNGLK